MSESVTPTQKTRIVCISDTHNYQPEVPAGDVLIHCGDLTNLGGYFELRSQVRWLESLPHKCKIVIAGNHDLTLHKEFYPTTWHSWIWPSPASACRALFTSSSSLIYLEHESKTIRLESPDGPHTEFKIFGSPYTPKSGKLDWAFQYEDYSTDNGQAAREIWDAIPLDADIVITHGPARGHRDYGFWGCEGLRQQLWRVRPRLHLCGHIHEARGSERITWNTNAKSARNMVAGVEKWKDPARDSEQGISLVDLTAKGGKQLQNDGSKFALASVTANTNADAQREGRKETCIVNCAINTGMWPSLKTHDLNKPIVVDLDLPVWREDPKRSKDLEVENERLNSRSCSTSRHRG